MEKGISHYSRVPNNNTVLNNSTGGEIIRILITVEYWIVLRGGNFIEIDSNVGFNDSTSKERGIFDNVPYCGEFIYTFNVVIIN